MIYSKGDRELNHIDIAVLSDIHSNYVALEQCIKYAVARDINNFIFLGDYVGELAYPGYYMAMMVCGLKNLLV